MKSKTILLVAAIALPIVCSKASAQVCGNGVFLGRLSANPYDPDSILNPYVRYGSQYSPTSINDPYSQYGSPYSPISPNNPYATQAPIMCGDDE